MWVTNGTASGSLRRRPLGLVCAVHQPPQLSGTPAAFGVQLQNIYGIWYRGKLNSHIRDQRFQTWTEVVWTRLYLEGNYFLSRWKRFNVNSKQRVYIKCHRGNGRGFKSYSAGDSFTGTHTGQEAVWYKLAGIEEFIEMLAENPASPVALEVVDSVHMTSSTKYTLSMYIDKIWVTAALI